MVYYGISIEFSLCFLFLTFSCYISYELECYGLLCIEIGNLNSKWNMKKLLKILSNSLMEIFKFLKTFSDIIALAILVQTLCIILLLSSCMFILMSVRIS